MSWIGFSRDKQDTKRVLKAMGLVDCSANKNQVYQNNRTKQQVQVYGGETAAFSFSVNNQSDIDWPQDSICECVYPRVAPEYKFQKVRLSKKQSMILLLDIQTEPVSHTREILLVFDFKAQSTMKVFGDAFSCHLVIHPRPEMPDLLPELPAPSDLLNLSDIMKPQPEQHQPLVSMSTNDFVHQVSQLGSLVSEE